jgi:hypothetical protein
VLGLAYSRPSGQLKKLDLLDTPALQALLDEYKPDGTLASLRAVDQTHVGQSLSIAQRNDSLTSSRRFVQLRDLCEAIMAAKNPEAAQKLNVAVPESIAKLCDERKILLIYISTDVGLLRRDMRPVDFIAVCLRRTRASDGLRRGCAAESAQHVGRTHMGLGTDRQGTATAK